MASWYQTAANLHKEWAKTYHTVSDLERYTSIHKLVIGKDVELKPGKVSFPGYPNQVSLKAKINNGAMAKVIGAADFAYNGEVFNSFTTDYSKCLKKINKTIVPITLEVFVLNLYQKVLR